MDQILQTLLTMTTTASVAALCVMGLRLLLKRAPRWITCLLWMVVFVRMVCPVSFSLPVSLVPAPIAQGTYVQQLGRRWRPPPAPRRLPRRTPAARQTKASAGPDRTDVVVGLWGRHLGHAPLGAFPTSVCAGGPGSHPARGQPL
ncbi:MAG: hypothetical protein ACLSF6_04455 [Evtepia gabavorous]